MSAEPRVLASGLNFPEGPAFAPDGTLWCVEARGGALVAWSERGLVRHDSGCLPCGLAFDAMGRAWFCDAKANAVRLLEPDTGRWETVATEVDGAPLNAPNDLAFDAIGNLVFSCPGDSRFEPTGVVCCLRPDGRVTTLLRDLYFPNGIAFSEDNRTLMVAETYGRRVWRGGWTAITASWHDVHPWAELGGDPGPDGLALGADGLLYVAALRSSAIKVVDEGGIVVRTIAVPGPRPTNVAFDPSGALGMVVTEAEHGLLLSYPDEGPGVTPFRPRR
ncbi:MAG: SMP-30/gluconolactonase/LRE family protein [Gemmatimonadetes bacterium]|nr:SMP-30/gluconolactonase/LRE family protein [Gemmatimonadota bacterium]